MTFRKGFTLIELLIVITIIGILAVALLPSVLGAPARARDAARKADLNNIVTGIETYNSDHGHYPAAVHNAGDCVQEMIPDLLSLFQGGKPPVDPQAHGVISCANPPPAKSYYYCQLNGTPASYMVMAQVEVMGDANTNALAMPNNCDTGGSAAPALVTPDGNGPWYYVILK